MALGEGLDAGIVYGLLQRIAEDVGTLKSDMTAMKASVGTLKEDNAALKEGWGDVRREIVEFKVDMHTFRVGTRRDLSNVKHDIAGLRQTVAQDHAAVLGHGVLITEPDERLRRVEDHRNLPRVA